VGLLQKVGFILIGSALLAIASTAPAQTSAWSRMAEDDLAAARALIVENHPGAVAGVGDREFQQQLARGYADALAIARSARTYGDYRAALMRFAAAFNDPHIQSAERTQVDRFWPGFIVRRRGGRWAVVEGAGENRPAAGSLLLSCDGQSPEALANTRLAPYHPGWNLAATRVRTSPNLLIDEGRSTHPRVGECIFEGASGEKRTHRLNWERISPSKLSQQISGSSRHPGDELALAEFEGGWWVRLGTLGARGVQFVEQARAKQEQLRSAPFVILDLRGNGGGASYVTDELARLIYGDDRVSEARRPAGAREPEQHVWRASPGSLETLEAYVVRAARIASADHPMARGLAAQREEVRRALASGTQIARAPSEIGERSEAANRKGKPPRVIMITDRFCFSSCLMGVALFRTLGAVQAGEETDANTRYSDLRTVDLPSGLSTFSTLQSYSTYSPARFGPYRPSTAYEGDLSDNVAVQEWVRSAILPGTGRSRAGN
jgi:hypothetical protein